MDAPRQHNGSTLVSVLGGIEILLVALVGYFLSQLVGNKDTSNDLVKTVLPVTGTLGGIVLLHTALWYVYFTYNPLSMNLYFLITTSLSLIISLTALSIAFTNRT
jgi:ABC-type antimicrobial peptide transport system permease subunit